ncbi:sensor histidine kinase [Inconstantimicrobium mannanitabidum]|uniref:sensor histidine kinase n=1 Tax=Inconstantimicrobium mannanitabidum TaxID=1604901 RepID=UPI0021C39CFA|nr:PAS domain-containing hybrid sensor histidine kinase/response regulator [Clostridium sp. TW13]
MDLSNEFWIDELQKIGKVGIFSFDMRSHTVTASEKGYELFGISGRKMEGTKDWLEVIHPSQRQELSSYFMEAIKTGKDFDKEFKIVEENNETERWVELKGKVFYDDQGMPEKLSGTIHDVSEIKKSEEKYKKLYIEFQEKESLLVSLINSIPDLIFYKDINSRYLGCNKAYENYSGMKEEDIVGHSDFDIFDEEEASFYREMDAKMIEKEEKVSYEQWIKYPDSREALLDTIKTPYYDSEGNILGIIGICRDITERIKKEELQRKMEEETIRLDKLKENDRIKTEFFANISHELRTPINVIFSALQMQEILFKEDKNENASIDKFKYIKMMKQNCYRLLRLINNLIDITKFDNGYFSINERNQDIIQLVEDVVLSVADYIEKKGISVTFDTDAEEKVIAVDTEKMERIILNLLSNAVKFTPSGGKIDVYIEDNDSDVCIRIKDTGIGIPQEKLNMIFERFVQVDKSLTRNHEGSGIGLSIVKSLVEQHGGNISVKSEEGKGTEFIIHIPCKLAVWEASTKNTGNTQISDDFIEKINIEFSDIYN